MLWWFCRRLHVWMCMGTVHLWCAHTRMLSIQIQIYIFLYFLYEVCILLYIAPVQCSHYTLLIALLRHVGVNRHAVTFSTVSKQCKL